jgi:hypothetical protein
MTKNEERRLTPGRRSEDATNSLLQHLADKFNSYEEERRERIRRMTDRMRGLRRVQEPAGASDDRR